MPVLKQKKEILIEVYNTIIDILEQPSGIDIEKLKNLWSNDSFPSGILFVKKRICEFLWEPDFPENYELKYDNLLYCLREVVNILKAYTNTNLLADDKYEEDIQKIKKTCDLDNKDIKCVLKHIEIISINVLMDERLDCRYRLVQDPF